MDHILDKPDITLSQDGKNAIIKEGDDVSLKCTILANPLYHTIVWTKQIYQTFYEFSTLKEAAIFFLRCINSFILMLDF